jgi:hypothetical protein
MICSGVFRLRFIESFSTLSGNSDSHNSWIRFRGSGHFAHS